jgi:hypothetical protein
MVTVVVLSISILAIGKSSATNVCKATNQIDWNGCCFTGNSNPCAGLTKQPLLQKLPEYSLLSMHSLPLKSSKSPNYTFTAGDLCKKTRWYGETLVVVHCFAKNLSTISINLLTVDCKSNGPFFFFPCQPLPNAGGALLRGNEYFRLCLRVPALIQNLYQYRPNSGV